MISCASTNHIEKAKWYQNDPRLVVINESTIIFKDVDKIEIKSNNINLITYIYNLSDYNLVKIAKGSFDIELKRGVYLIQSNKPITKVAYEVIIE